VINIIVGIIFIIGGLSGTLALKGTGSPLALSAVGVVLCIWGFIQMSQGRKRSGSSTRRTVRKATGRTTATAAGRKRPTRSRA
jgi:hypothetical protein